MTLDKRIPPQFVLFRVQDLRFILQFSSPPSCCLTFASCNTLDFFLKNMENVCTLRVSGVTYFRATCHTVTIEKPNFFGCMMNAAGDTPPKKTGSLDSYSVSKFIPTKKHFLVTHLSTGLLRIKISCFQHSISGVGVRFTSLHGGALLVVNVICHPSKPYKSPQLYV